ncbi:hypothetical protein SeMB42_g05835, partial [Synchytrium endobioticum]
MRWIKCIDHIMWAVQKRNKKSLDRVAIVQKATAIRTSNYWDPLLELMNKEDFEIETACNAFTAASQNIIKDESLTINGNGAARKPGRNLSRSTKALLHKKACLFKAAQSNPGNVDALNEYKGIKQRVSLAIKEDREASWLTYVKQGVTHLTEMSPRKLWKWIKNTSGVGSKSSKNTHPLKDAKGDMKTSDSDIADIWIEHYRKLAQESRENFRSAEYWETSQQLTKLSELEVNGPLSWSEIRGVIAGMRKNKSAGEDGLPAEWYKVCLTEDDDEVPKSKLAIVIYKLIGKMFENGHIPPAWNSAPVVAVPKKGDLGDKDNYRGIALINCFIKILTRVISNRIMSQLESSNRLCVAQAGFRSREECVAQTVALWDVCERRRAVGKPTYALFVDFQKAYDTVPHGALFANSASLRAKVGDHLSKEVKIEKGVRQGDPLSTTLFDIFINDFEVSMGEGITVPGMAECDKISCLKFADDIVILAESTLELQKQQKKAAEWASSWGMNVNAGKCGVMAIHGDNDELRTVDWRMQGNPVPVVNTYQYLGIPVNTEWKLKDVIEQRAEKGKKAYWGLAHFLRSESIPLEIRIATCRASVIPVLMYASELWGTAAKVEIEELDRVHAMGVKSLAGLRLSSNLTSLECLRTELGLRSVTEKARLAVARAEVKYPTLKTWIAKLALARRTKNSWFSR